MIVLFLIQHEIDTCVHHYVLTEIAFQAQSTYAVPSIHHSLFKHCLAVCIYLRGIPTGKVTLGGEERA